MIYLILKLSREFGHDFLSLGFLWGPFVIIKDIKINKKYLKYTKGMSTRMSVKTHMELQRREFLILQQP